MNNGPNDQTNPLERAAADLLAQPIPETLNQSTVQRRARTVRRQRQATVVAALLAFLVVAGGVIGASRRSSDTQSIDFVTAPSQTSAQRNDHRQHFTFVGESDDASRQLTAAGVVQRYHRMGFEASVTSIDESGFDLVEDVAIGSPSAVAQAIIDPGITRVVGQVTSDVDPCEPPAFPQLDPETGDLHNCYEPSIHNPVDPGDAPLVRDTKVRQGEDGHGALEATIDPQFQSSFMALADGCAQPSEACPQAKMLLVWDESSILAHVQVVEDPNAVDPDEVHVRLDGLFDETQARLLGAVLESGRLPVALEYVPPPPDPEPGPESTDRPINRFPTPRSTLPPVIIPTTTAPPVEPSTTTTTANPCTTTTTAPFTNSGNCGTTTTTGHPSTTTTSTVPSSTTTTATVATTTTTGP